jgi:hypothetical protein
MAYQGYLLKVGSKVFPTSYIQGKTYKATPDQTMEWEAARDATGWLDRDTVQHKPSKIEFETIPHLTNADMRALHELFQTEWTDELQRKASITFYNTRTDDYQTEEMYLPDIEYPIYSVDNDNMVVTYESIRFAFIGY